MKIDIQNISDLKDNGKQPLILRIIVGLAVPFIMVFGLYIIFNGHLSPGGGFSGGAILGAGMSLLALAYGQQRVRQFFTFTTFRNLSCVALLFYALVKGVSFFTGATETYAKAEGIAKAGEGFKILPLGTPGNIFSAGLILPLNICVGMVVGCTIYGLFALFSEGEV